MKTKHIILAISALLVVSLGVNAYHFVAIANERTTNNELQAEVDRLGDLYSPVYQYFTALSLEDFKQKVASGERFTAYIGRPNCGDCNSFEPTFEQIIQERQLANKLYYVNVRWIHGGDKAEWNKFKEIYGFTQTPAFSTYADGKQVSMIEWTDKGLVRSELEAWLRMQGIM